MRIDRSACSSDWGGEWERVRASRLHVLERGNKNNGNNDTDEV
jgi:hypothetical protein